MSENVNILILPFYLRLFVFYFCFICTLYSQVRDKPNRMTTHEVSGSHLAFKLQKEQTDMFNSSDDCYHFGNQGNN